MRHPLLDTFHVKLPWTTLVDGGLDHFLTQRIRPELCFESGEMSWITPEDVRPVAKALLRENLSCTLHAPFLGMEAGSPDPAERDRKRKAMEATMRIAEPLAPRVIVIHGGPPYVQSDPELLAWQERSLEIYAWMARACADLGITLAVENICHTRASLLAQLIEHLRAMDKGVGWCFDVGHRPLFSKEPLDTWIATLGPYLKHMHIHDNDGVEDLHRYPGWGVIDFRQLFNRLAPLQQPHATLEVRYDRDLAKSLEALETRWPW